MDSIIRMGTAEAETKLFRATFDDFVQPYIVGDIYQYPTYMSTSTDEFGLQRHWSGRHGRVPVLLKIICPAGTHMIDGEMNPSHGGYEAEVILGRGSRFQVLSTANILDFSLITAIMGGYYATGVSMLKVYELNFVQ